MNTEDKNKTIDLNETAITLEVDSDLIENQGDRYLISCYTNTSKEGVIKNKDKHNDESESIIG